MTGRARRSMASDLHNLKKPCCECQCRVCRVNSRTDKRFQDHGNGRGSVDSETIVDVTAYVIFSSKILNWAGGTSNPGAGHGLPYGRDSRSAWSLIQDRADSNLRVCYLHVSARLSEMLSSSPSISTCGLQSPAFFVTLSIKVEGVDIE